jgi:serine phosphatase RsbU (regulator of sigma subunit)
MIITFTDITEQKRAEEQLRAANAQLAARQAEIDRDLALAARVQQSLAPRSLAWGPFRVEALYQPVSTIGGDFGVVAPVGSLLHLLVCDVSGHGISSALIANRIYTETMSLLGRCAEAQEMLRRLNTFVLHEIKMSGFYFSMAMAQLDSQRRRMCFLNAGHPPAIWVRASGESTLLHARSAVLGLLDDAVDSSPAEEVDLAPGDRVMLYTDGISEAFNEKDELLGHEGLQEIVRRAARRPLPEMKAQVLDEVAAWRNGPISDDMSMVLIEVT